MSARAIENLSSKKLKPFLCRPLIQSFRSNIHGKLFTSDAHVEDKLLIYVFPSMILKRISSLSESSDAGRPVLNTDNSKQQLPKQKIAL